MYDENIIYAQVLLLDEKIEAWKICQSAKSNPMEFKAFWKMQRLRDYTMDTKVFKAEETEIPEGWTFNSYVYEVLAPRWINKYPYADDLKGVKAEEMSLNEIL